MVLCSHSITSESTQHPTALIGDGNFDYLVDFFYYPVVIFFPCK